MADWSGFTEEDLLNVRQENYMEKQRGRCSKKSGKLPTKSVTNCTIKVRDERTYEVVERCQKSPDNKEVDVPSEPLVKATSPDDKKHQDGKLPPERKLHTLEDFHQRQRVFEEQNRKRKAMLVDAIAERQKKTSLESEKLLHIKSELQKLDTLVSNDVSILRNRIESASVEFSEAQKRYEKAEEEFVQAKMILFQKMDIKEQLTQHLYTIIENNELRKAKKLAQLMEELQLECKLDEYEEITNDAILPNICTSSENLDSGKKSTLKNIPSDTELGSEQSTAEIDNESIANNSSEINAIDAQSISASPS